VSDRTAVAEYVVLGPEDYRTLGERDFGMPGLTAVESIGPYVDVQAVGPLIMVHDATVDAHLGIGHHPHRHNERLFYITQGQLDHDDTLNNIQGHIGEGDVGLFTEGRRGMVHSEWNNGDVDTRAYILVYSTDPVPETTALTVLADADAPRYDEGAGVRTKELVGPRSPLRLHGDLRLVTDSVMDDSASLTIAPGDGEGGLLFVREGAVRLDGRELPRGTTALLPPADGERSLSVEAAGSATVVRVVFGRGHGFVRRAGRRP
jgi:redox-sensitive bicupin YhaK (pirin superfamily)